MALRLIDFQLTEKLVEAPIGGVHGEVTLPPSGVSSVVRLYSTEFRDRLFVDKLETDKEGCRMIQPS